MNERVAGMNKFIDTWDIVQLLCLLAILFEMCLIQKWAQLQQLKPNLFEKKKKTFEKGPNQLEDIVKKFPYIKSVWSKKKKKKKKKKQTKN